MEVLLVGHYIYPNIYDENDLPMKQFRLLPGFFLTLIAALCYCTSPGSPKADVLTGDTPRAVDSIDATTATTEKNSWIAERTMIDERLGDTDTNFIVEGFRIHRGDLEGMLNALNDSASAYPDSVWAMLGIRNDTLTLIFQTRDKKTGREVYYDFTSPCPPMCPN